MHSTIPSKSPSKSRKSRKSPKSPSVLAAAPAAPAVPAADPTPEEAAGTGRPPCRSAAGGDRLSRPRHRRQPPRSTPCDPAAAASPFPAGGSAPPCRAADAAVTRHSWDDLVPRYGDVLRQAARRTLQCCGLAATAGDVEDLVQEAWCRLFEHFGAAVALSGDEQVVRAYLWRTTRNVTLDEVRRRRTRKRGHGWRHLSTAAGGLEETGIEDRRSDPEQDLLHRERRRRFRRRCLPLLSRRPGLRRRDLDIVEMALLDGLPSRQVARRVGGGLTSGTVDAVVHRLRSRLAAEGVAVPRRG